MNHKLKEYLLYQVETLQDSIAKLRQDIKEARERGEEKERQQQRQVKWQ